MIEKRGGVGRFDGGAHTVCSRQRLARPNQEGCGQNSRKRVLALGHDDGSESDTG
jgi:hypothetical protein